MGGKESKTSFLPYEEAIKRVSEDELERIRETFKRYSGNSNVLSKSVFIGEVLGELIPPRLSEQLFRTCGGTSKGISFREVLALLVLITNGTLNEKVRFLFNLMSVDGAVITREDLENFYSACDGGTVIPKCVHEAFWRTDKLNYNEFYQWVLCNPVFSAATRWLLEEQRANHGLTSGYDTQSFYRSLATISKLKEPEIIELEKWYWSLKSISNTGKFDLEAFKAHICPPLPEMFSQGVFEFFDKNNDGHVDFKELVCGISTCCRGSNTERLRACFEIFDNDKDGYLSETEFSNVSAGLLEICQQYGNKDIDETSILQDLKIPQDNSCSLEDFQPWAYSSWPIYEFLLLLSQICHIILGLKPLSRREEGSIVRRWIQRENNKGLQFGSLYYIVSAKWWNSWKKYCYFNVNNLHTQLMAKDPVDSAISNSIDPGHVDMVSGNEVDTKKHPCRESLKSHNLIYMTNGVVSNSSLTQPSAIENMFLVAPQDNRKVMVLTGEGGQLKQDIDLTYGKDYEVIPEPIWKALYTWYDGDVALPRTVIVDRGDSVPELELYPIPIDLYRHTPSPKGVPFSLNTLGINNIVAHIYGNIVGNAPAGNTAEQTQIVAPKISLQYRACFSRKNTVRQIIDFLSQRLKIGVEDLRIWVMQDENEKLLLEEDDKCIGEVCSLDGGKILIEVRNRDLSWPEEMNSLVTTRNFRERSNTGPLEKGATGLHNLGNTCFMNSAVQCLSNTKPLTMYFADNFFEYELNKSNPLGMKGILAKRYGDLILDLWSGIYRSIAPVKLRCTIGRYAPRFNGFQQHDSQEFLSFLLDGLHEDVNRVHDKPYVELKDSDGRPDAAVAEEAWDNHVKRNQSIIVDLFQGQLKSQVRCLHCGHASVTFDPFTFLSLPLPMESSIHFEIPVFFASGQQAKRYGILLPQVSTVKLLKSKLSSLSLVPAEKLLLVEVGGPVILKLLRDKQKIQPNVAGYIFAYELDINANIIFRKKIPSSNLITTASTPDLTNSTMRKSSSTVFTNISSISTSCDKQGSWSSSGLKSINVGNHSLDRKLKNSSKNISKTKIDVQVDSSEKVSPTKIVEVSSCNSIDSNSDSSLKDNDLLQLPNSPMRRISALSSDGILASSNSSLHSLSSENTFDSPHQGIVIAMHRKMIQSTHYFLSWQRFRPNLFGIPVVFSCYSGLTNKDVYDKIWINVKKYVTGVTLGNDDRRYPFDIKCVDKNGLYCVWCPWYRYCRGCKIAYDDTPFNLASTYLAIDWDSTTLHLHYQQSQEKNFLDDSSIDESHKLLREPISLDQCLKDFTKEEELGEEETWHCSKCKEHRTIAKKLDIWKLPPIFVIHLKRFQSVNNRWIKSNKLVRFPTKTFDASMYLAKSRITERSVSNHESELPAMSSTPTKVSSNDSDLHPTNSSLPDTSAPIVNGILSSSFSIEDVSSIEMNECNDVLHQDHFDECVYSLYAISCHSGMLNGGHYITYAKNRNSKWYCYNDSSCKEVDSSVIEKESPYMLFFERRSLDSSFYMPVVKDKEPASIQQEEEEFEKEVKKYCSIM